MESGHRLWWVFALLGLLLLACPVVVGAGVLWFSFGPGTADRGGPALAEATAGAPWPAAGEVAAAPTPASQVPIPEAPAAAVAHEPLPLAGVDVMGGADLTRLYEQVNPGVVSIGVVQEVVVGGRRFEQAGGGSGFVLDGRHVVTNNHVAGDSESVEVIFHDGQHRRGTVVGADGYSDLAVVRVDGMPAGVRALPLAADFGRIRVGQPVVAIGSPFGRANSMTYGIVSALGRTIPADVEQGFVIPQTIQTDAAINPGNSGGPLLDLSGQVIGVNAQINTTNVQPDSGMPGNSGVGFAIPSSIVARVAPVLIDRGAYDWPYLGVGGLPQQQFTVEVAQANNLANTRGAYIMNVRPDGPSVGHLRGAEESAPADPDDALPATPRGGDVVVAIDGQPIASFDDLLSYIAMETAPGQDVTLGVIRQGQPIEVTVTLARRPPD